MERRWRMNAWLQFATCAALILAAGPVLTRQAENLAGVFGWTRTWVGGILLALATSLPELITGISAVSLADAPNIAIGDALGSCIFNLMLLAVLDILCREDSAFSHADEGHVLVVALGTLMLGIVGIALLTAVAGYDPVIGHVSLYSVPILLIYLIVVRAISLHQRRSGSGGNAPAPAQAAIRPAMYFGLAALAVAAAGTWLPIAAAAIAEQTGWGKSFVGTVLVAATTSLPEFAVMLAALRMRSVDMAIAGLVGSNIFNMAIIALDDVAYGKGSLFTASSPAHVGTVLSAIVMSSVVIAAVIDRPKVRVFGRIGWVSLFLAALYALSAYSVYLFG